MCSVIVFTTLNRSPAPTAVEVGQVRSHGSAPGKLTGMVFAQQWRQRQQQIWEVANGGRVSGLDASAQAGGEPKCAAGGP